MGRWGIQGVTYALLSVGALMMVTPFLWMLITSFKPAPELVEFAWLPIISHLWSTTSVC